jgi:Sporulation and spore germination
MHGHMHSHTVFLRRLRPTLDTDAPLLMLSLLSVLSVLVLTGCGTTATAGASAGATSTAQPTATSVASNGTGTGTTYPVLVYFSRGQASLDDPHAVFPVPRVSPTLAVATYAMEQLIAGPTPSEKTAGYFTELTTVLHRNDPSSCGDADFMLTLDTRGTRAEPGTATLQFCRPTTSPGIGADARITAEISRTLTQFASITKVAILNRQGDCFGELSGLNRCLQ